MKGRLLFVNNQSAFFLAHRRDLATAAQRDGWEVHVATPADAAQPRVRDAGFIVHDLPVSRSGLRPDRELGALRTLVRVIRQVRPQIVHAIALKALVLAGLAVRLAPVPGTVLATMGLGHAFTDSGPQARALRLFMRAVLPLIVTPRSRLVHQNPGDLERLAFTPTIRRRSQVILGSGVDVERFAASEEPPEPVAVVLPARMIRPKGIGIFVEAARHLRAEGVAGRFLLAGDVDPDNPESIPRVQLQDWHAEGAVEWLGHCGDMPGLLAASHIVCLPTYYGEGVPQSLLEAAASARPIVTTDISGCRDAVGDGVNGLLVPPQDPPALAAALRALIGDRELRHRLGAAGRRRAVEEFGNAKVAAETFQVYRELAG